jgi:hypothetical protein
MKLDRTKICVVDLKDTSDMDYWKGCTPDERLQALQVNRECAYGKSEANARLQRVLEIVERT